MALILLCDQKRLDSWGWPVMSATAIGDGWNEYASGSDISREVGCRNVNDYLDTLECYNFVGRLGQPCFSPKCKAVVMLHTCCGAPLPHGGLSRSSECTVCISGFVCYLWLDPNLYCV